MSLSLRLSLFVRPLACWCTDDDVVREGGGNMPRLENLHFWQLKVVKNMPVSISRQKRGRGGCENSCCGGGGREQVCNEGRGGEECGVVYAFHHPLPSPPLLTTHTHYSLAKSHSMPLSLLFFDSHSLSFSYSPPPPNPLMIHSTQI